MSPSRSIIHKLSPSIEAAMADMLEIHYTGVTQENRFTSLAAISTLEV